MSKTGLLIALTAAFAFSSFASTEFRIQKVKTLGPMKHKVIFQSADLKKVRGTNVLKGKLVAQWGLHVFEVVTGFYSCNRSNLCKLTDYERVATYEKCVVKSESKVECRKRLTGSSSGGGSSDYDVVDDGPDSVKDEYHRDRRYNDEYSEFPVRIGDEYSDILF